MEVHTLDINITGFIHRWFAVYVVGCVKPGPVSDMEKKCYIGLLLSGRMEIKSHLLPSHLALSEKEISSNPSFRGVVQLLSRMDSCIFNYCSVLHLVFMKEL